MVVIIGMEVGVGTGDTYEGRRLLRCGRIRLLYTGLGSGDGSGELVEGVLFPCLDSLGLKILPRPLTCSERMAESSVQIQHNFKIGTHLLSQYQHMHSHAKPASRAQRSLVGVFPT